MLHAPIPDAAPPIDWEIALAQHRPWLRKVIHSRVGDAHAADDLEQELALAALKHSNPPRDPSRVAPWLYRLAVRIAINHHRRNGRTRRQLARWADHLQPPSAGDPLQWLIAREHSVVLHQAFGNLPPQDRELLVLKYTEQWSYRELAEHLGVSTGCIEYRLFQARNRLRAALTTLFHPEPNR